MSVEGEHARRAIFDRAPPPLRTNSARWIELGMRVDF